MRINLERDAPDADCGDYQVFQAAEKDETVIVLIVSAQREEQEQEIAGLQAEAERMAEEALELAGKVPF